MADMADDARNLERAVDEFGRKVNQALAETAQRVENVERNADRIRSELSRVTRYHAAQSETGKSYVIEDAQTGGFYQGTGNRRRTYPTLEGAQARAVRLNQGQTPQEVEAAVYPRRTSAAAQALQGELRTLSEQAGALRRELQLAESAQKEATAATRSNTGAQRPARGGSARGTAGNGKQFDDAEFNRLLAPLEQQARSARAIAEQYERQLAAGTAAAPGTPAYEQARRAAAQDLNARAAVSGQPPAPPEPFYRGGRGTVAGYRPQLGVDPSLSRYGLVPRESAGGSAGVMAAFRELDAAQRAREARAERDLLERQAQAIARQDVAARLAAEAAAADAEAQRKAAAPVTLASQRQARETGAGDILRARQVAESTRAQTAYYENVEEAARRAALTQNLQARQYERSSREAGAVDIIRGRQLAEATRAQQEYADSLGTGLVRRTPANAGFATRAELQAAAPGPAFGESQVYAPISQPSGQPVVSYGQQADALVAKSQKAIEAVEKLNAKVFEKVADKRAAVLGRQAEQDARDLARMAELEASDAARTASLRTEFDRTGASLANFDQGMRRHGALTTEFISNALKGTASYKEWGFQIGATAAKFAGWTAVSIPVFAAIDGVRQIGAGAVASSSGVQQLQRTLDNVDSGEAQRAFSDLAGQFNVPISDASDAVFQFSQIFRSVPDSVNAARAALSAFKVGGVDVDTGVRELSAVVAGFGLQANQLGPIFDQINEAQNRFGVQIGSTLAGMASAAGSFRNFGGSVSYLLALIATMEKVTGRSGQNIGTAIQRSVTAMQRPSNQAALRSLGIQGTNVEDVFGQAFQLAQGAGPQRLQQIAQAISTPQYSSYFVPLLQNYGRFQEILTDTSPQASAGSAGRELGHTLSQLNEQIARVGVNLQRFGSALSSAGFLAPLGVGLHMVNGMLGASSSMLGVFSQMPGPLQQMVGLLAAARVSAFALRRGNVGDALRDTRFEGLAGFLVEPPQRRARRAIGQGIDSTVQATRDEAQRAVQNARRASGEVVYLDAGKDARLAAIDDAGLSEGERARQRIRVYEQLEEAERRAEAASARATAAVREAAEAEMLQADFRSQVRGVPHAERDLAAAEFAEQRGLPFNPSLRTSAPLAEMAEFGTFNRETGQVELANRAGQAVQVENAAIQSRRVRQTFRDMLTGIGTDAAVAWAALRAGGLKDGLKGASAAAGAAADARTKQLGSSIGAVSAAAGRAAVSMRGLGVAMLGMLGPFELLIGALYLFPAIFNSLKSQTADLERVQQIASAPPAGTTAARKRQDDELQKIAQKQPGFLSGLLDDARNAIGADLQAIGLGNGVDYSAIDTAGGTTAYAAQHAQQLLDLQRKQEQQWSDVYRDHPAQARAGVPVDQISRNIDQDFNAFQQGRIGIDELNARLNARYTEILQSDSGQQAKSTVALNLRLRQALTQPTTRGSLTGILNIGQPGGIGVLDRTDLQNHIEALDALAQAGQATDTQVQQLTALYLAVIAKTRGKTDVKSIEAYAAATQGLNQSLTGAAQNELSRALIFAHSQDQRDRAYQAYFRSTDTGGLRRQIKQQYAGRIGDLNRQAAAAQARADALRPTAVAQAAVPGLAGTPEAGVAAGAYAAAQAQADSLRASAKAAQKDQDEILKALGVTSAERRAIREQIRQQLYEADEQSRQLRATIALGNAAAGMPRLGLAIRQAGAAYNRAVEQFGRNSDEALKAMAQVQQAQVAQTEYQASVIQAGAALSSAQQTTQVGKGAANIAGLQALAGYQAAHPEAFTDADRTNLAAQIAEARQAQAELLAQQARDLISAQAALARSQTDNPIQQARIDLTEAQRLQAAGGFQTEADRIQAQANVNAKRQALLQTTTQRRIDNIEFDASIDRITVDQEIAAFQAIESTLRRGSELRRDLHQKILQLKHDRDQNVGSLDLNVGDIRLPTLYEIRRAVLGRNAGVSVTNHNSNAVTINVDRSTDMNQLGATLEAHLNGAGRSVARASGVL